MEDNTTYRRVEADETRRGGSLRGNYGETGRGRYEGARHQTTQDEAMPPQPQAQDNEGDIFGKSAREVTGKDLFIAIGAMAMAFLAFVVAAIVAAVVFGADGDSLEFVLDTYAEPALKVAVIVVLYFAFKSRGWTWRQAGFTKLPKRAWNMMWQVPLTTAATMLAVVPLAGVLGFENNNAESNDALLSGATPASLVVSLIGTVILAPIFEEFVFRRLFVGWMSKWMSPLAAVFVVGIIFGVLHINPYAILWVSCLGIWAGIFTLHYKSLWAGIIVHMVNNALAASALFVALLQG